MQSHTPTEFDPLLTPLFTAIKNEDLEKLEWLLMQYFSSTLDSYDYIHLLQAACVTQQSSFIKLVTSYFPYQFTAINDSGVTALHQACSFGYTEAVAWLLTQHKLEDFSPSQDQHLNPFYTAILHPQLLEFFIDRYPQKTLFSESGQLLLQQAIQLCLELQNCQCGADAHCNCFASAQTCKQSIQLLLQNGAGICADVTGLEKIEMDFKNYLFIGATCHRQSAHFQGAIHDRAELQEALLRGIIFKKPIKEVISYYVIHPTHKDCIELKKALDYLRFFKSSLKTLCFSVLRKHDALHVQAVTPQLPRELQVKLCNPSKFKC